MTDEIRTVLLGRYDEFEADIVIEILREAGIFAEPKQKMEEGAHFPYPGVTDELGTVLVDAARVDEARQIVEEQLPLHVASIQEAMAALEVEGQHVDVRLDEPSDEEEG